MINLHWIAFPATLFTLGLTCTVFGGLLISLGQDNAAPLPELDQNHLPTLKERFSDKTPSERCKNDGEIAIWPSDPLEINVTGLQEFRDAQDCINDFELEILPRYHYPGIIYILTAIFAILKGLVHLYTHYELTGTLDPYISSRTASLIPEDVLYYDDELAMR